MVLISIVIGLALERCCDIGQILRRFNWFSFYLNKYQPVIRATTTISPYLALLLTVLLPVIIVAILYYLLCGWLWGLIGFLINVVVLIYCLGPATLYRQWQSYINARDNHDEVVADEIGSELLGGESPNANDYPRAMSHALFWQSYQRLFAVLFWFTIFGWIGALVYRLVAQSVCVSKDDETVGELHTAAQWTQRVLDWIPARVVGITYMVVGAFSPAFLTWLRHFLSGLTTNQQIVTETGLAAITRKQDETKVSDTPGLTEDREAALLVERSLIAWVVIVALLTIGRFVV